MSNYNRDPLTAEDQAIHLRLQSYPSLTDHVVDTIRTNNGARVGHALLAKANISSAHALERGLTEYGFSVRSREVY